MCDDMKSGLLALVDQFSTDPDISWDSPLSWAAIVDALAGLMVELRGSLSPSQITTLATVAVMAQRHAMEPPAVPVKAGGAA